MRAEPHHARLFSGVGGRGLGSLFGFALFWGRVGGVLCLDVRRPPLADSADAAKRERLNWSSIFRARSASRRVACLHIRLVRLVTS